ncbi:MAG: hypothetical protein JXQ71_08885 [Verrucomicrobia bacterium]|nr:hypothetical protein [Verrucomicrobiota bacterium]
MTLAKTMWRVAFMAGISTAPALAVPAAPAPDTAWHAGPYLMLDDSLTVQHARLQRRVNRPSRLPDPVVTGFEDGCFQPYVTVLRDPQTRRFRMWYNTPAAPGAHAASALAHLESDDGIHWLRPHRRLDTPPIQFGASVLDEGPAFPDAPRRFKLAWWKDGGLHVAASPDGLAWTPLAPGRVVAANHDITGIDWDPIRKRYLAFLSAVASQGTWKGLRIPHASVSGDLIHWRPPWPTITPDPHAPIEKGETQFYGMSAMLPRGRLLVSMVKVLRDDVNAEPHKTAGELHDPDRPFAGIGYTVLAWSHDGEHWRRDTEPFLERSHAPGAWDRAMAWADDQLIVGDFTYIYYGGYRWGHKAKRFTDRQIGFAHMPRDRYAGFVAGDQEERLLTRPGTLLALQMTVNARVDPEHGALRVRILDDARQPYPGFDWDDCRPAVRGDRVNHPVAWKGTNTALAGKTVRFEFGLKRATLWSFDLNP